ncbi:hypothetical protein [Mycobacterium vicinigordonae]|nr:hypothetical protein [Mycobacterium vicinigordonae]
MACNQGFCNRFLAIVTVIAIAIAIAIAAVIAKPNARGQRAGSSRGWGYPWSLPRWCWLRHRRRVAHSRRDLRRMQMRRGYPRCPGRSTSQGRRGPRRRQ